MARYVLTRPRTAELIVYHYFQNRTAAKAFADWQGFTKYTVTALEPAPEPAPVKHCPKCNRVLNREGNCLYHHLTEDSAWID